jgi:5'-3' exonuclease
MGIPKLKQVIRKCFPNVLSDINILREKTFKKSYDHIFLDLNFFFYFFSRKNFTTPKSLIEPIYEEFDRIINLFDVKKSFNVFIDGSPPILKIPRMYKNRIRNKFIHQLQITPETIFMKNMKIFCEEYSKFCEKKGIQFSISGSDEG